MAQGGQEMDRCVAQGKFPIFGYPLVCYSPIGRKDHERDAFWGQLFRCTMKPRKEGTINLIGELLEKNEEFVKMEEELNRDFAKGRLTRSSLSPD